MLAVKLNEIKKLCHSTHYNNHRVNLMKLFVNKQGEFGKTWLIEVITNMAGYLQILTILATVVLDPMVLN